MIEIPEDKKARKEFSRGLYRNKLSYFVERTFQELNPRTPYCHGLHIDLICEHLQATLTGELKRLIINLPPQMLKSTIVSVAFPAWAIGRNPSLRFIGASYAGHLSMNHNQQTRTIMQSPWFQAAFPRCALREDVRTKRFFMTTEFGFRMSTSVGAAATGFGGNVLIMDDPHDPKQADSIPERTAALDWFNGTFMTRLSDKINGAVIIVMQRLHEKDVTGDQLEKGGWHHLSLPATAEKQEYVSFKGVNWKREVDELLQPELLTAEFLTAQKKQLGTIRYAGQYQQRPVPKEGGTFKKEWFRYYDQLPAEFLRKVLSWDTANEVKELNDPTVCTVWGETHDAFFLIYRLRERLDYTDLKRKFLFLAAEYKPDHILVENKASGTQLIQEARRTTKLPITGIMPKVEKEIRAQAVTPLFEAGKVFIPRESKWVDEYVDEMTTFPASEHKDQVDSTSQFLNWVMQNPVSTSAKRYKPLTVANVDYST